MTLNRRTILNFYLHEQLVNDFVIIDRSSE